MKVIRILCVLGLIAPICAYGQHEHELPVAIVQLASTTTRVGVSTDFDCGSSYDPLEKEIKEYRIDFGDTITAESATAYFTHQYASTGQFVATLVITTQDGRVSEADTATIVVLPPNNPPVVKVSEYGSDVWVASDQTAYVQVSVTDPDNDQIKKVTAYFDDGEIIEKSYTSYLSCTHKYEVPGQYYVTVIAYDGYDYSPPALFKMTVTEHAVATVSYCPTKKRVQIKTSSSCPQAKLCVRIPSQNGYLYLVLPEDSTEMTVFGVLIPKEQRSFVITSSKGGKMEGYISEGECE